MRKTFIIILSVIFILSGCDYKLRPNEDDGDKRIEVKRYDRLQCQYLTTGDFAALQQMNTEFPIETRTLIEDILHIGEVDDPNISKTFLKYYLYP